YDYREVIGRVESGIETESNAGAVTETQSAQRAQSFTLLTAPQALLKIKSFSLCSLCLCGEKLLMLL
ncbi:MAG: hypothetical protein RQ982_02575, partial [Gammaproteobacteria bacterium]|nr:hypothetical protein [Gammaproteobacteria bacterium]